MVYLEKYKVWKMKSVIKNKFYKPIYRQNKNKIEFIESPTDNFT